MAWGSSDQSVGGGTPSAGGTWRIIPGRDVSGDRITPMYKPKKGHLEGHFLTGMILQHLEGHLLTGMILQLC